MRIEDSRTVEHLGSVRLHAVRRVLELDPCAYQNGKSGAAADSCEIGIEAMQSINSRMAIVLPVKNEDLKVFEGVLCGIPHDCLIIVVSNSQRAEVDFFKSEQDILTRFCQATRRRALIAHQKDPFLAMALDHAGYSDLLDEHSYIRSGKSEGMILGIIMAKLMQKDYVGFIDSDNFIPGAVLEYARHFALGFSMSDSARAMVRVLWHYKPKIQGGLYFKKWGRVSEITNRHINHLLSTKGRFETEIIKTANAGEHAMTMSLALSLTYASGYGVETQELISVLEQFGGILPLSEKPGPEGSVDIIQTETVNPHLHEERGDSEHLYSDMLMPSLSVIYHSPLCEESTRSLISGQLAELECIQGGAEPAPVTLYPPPGKIDFKMMLDEIGDHLTEISVPPGWTDKERAPVRRTPSEAHRVVFTDLDGTLLHPSSGSYAPALEGIRDLQAKNAPLVFCSAKTRAEQENLRRELGVHDPFIVENGGAVLIPEDYFRFPFNYDRKSGGYFIIDLGEPYAEIRRRLKLVAGETGGLFKAYGDMTLEEVARFTGLNLTLAAMAREREYSETIIVPGGPRDVETLRHAMSRQGLHFACGGRFYEASLGSDKGKGVGILSQLFKLNYGNIATFGIGNGENDEEMLSEVDTPLLVQTAERRWARLGVKKLVKVKGVGPEGWSRAVREVVLRPGAVTVG